MVIAFQVILLTLYFSFTDLKILWVSNNNYYSLLNKFARHYSGHSLSSCNHFIIIIIITFTVEVRKLRHRTSKYLAKFAYLVHGRASSETKKSGIRGHELNFGFCSFFPLLHHKYFSISVKTLHKYICLQLYNPLSHRSLYEILK